MIYRKNETRYVSYAQSKKDVKSMFFILAVWMR